MECVADSPFTLFGLLLEHSISPQHAIYLFERSPQIRSSYWIKNYGNRSEFQGQNKSDNNLHYLQTP